MSFKQMMIKKWSYTAHTFTLYSLCQEKLWGFWKVKEEATLSKLSEREKLWYVNVNDVNCFQTCHLVIYEERCLTRASRLMLRSVLGGFLKGISTNCQAKFCPLSRKWVNELLRTNYSVSGNVNLYLCVSKAARLSLILTKRKSRETAERWLRTAVSRWVHGKMPASVVIYIYFYFYFWREKSWWNGIV